MNNSIISNIIIFLSSIQFFLKFIHKLNFCINNNCKITWNYPYFCYSVVTITIRWNFTSYVSTTIVSSIHLDKTFMQINYESLWIHTYISSIVLSYNAWHARIIQLHYLSWTSSKVSLCNVLTKEKLDKFYINF